MEIEIGQKVRGFRFQDRTDGVHWNDNQMVRYIGEIGKVDYKDYSGNFTISFDDGTTWTYPKSLIHEHIVESEITNNLKNSTMEVGQTAYGFFFEREETASGGVMAYNFDYEMNDYIGKAGKVVSIDTDRSRFHLIFEDGEQWCYPLHLAEERSKPLVVGQQAVGFEFLSGTQGVLMLSGGSGGSGMRVG